MIKRLHKIASQLHPFRSIFIMITGASLLLGFALVLGFIRTDDDNWLILAIVVFCWSGLAYCLTSLFYRIPDSDRKGRGIRDKIRLFFLRRAYGVLALLSVCLSLAVLLVSYQLLRNWIVT